MQKNKKRKKKIIWHAKKINFFMYKIFFDSIFNFMLLFAPVLPTANFASFSLPACRKLLLLFLWLLQKINNLCCN